MKVLGAAATRFKREYYKRWLANDVVVASQQEVSKRIRKLFPDLTILWMDGKYRVCSRAAMERLVERCWVQEQEYVSEFFDCPVGEKTAYALGLFFADGYCNLKQDGVYGGANWNITNTSIDLLEAAKEGLASIVPDGLYFEIKSYPSEAAGKRTNLGIRKSSLHHLEVKTRKHGARGPWIEQFRRLFYVGDEKIVPMALLHESPPREKLAFLRGAYDGDGTNRCNIDVPSRASVAGLIMLMEDLGWHYRLYTYPNDNAYKIFFSTRDPERSKLLIALADLGGKGYLGQLSTILKRGPYTIKSWLRQLEERGLVRLHERWSSTNWSPRVYGELIPHETHCENYASLFQSVLGVHYRINNVGIVINYSGQHAFNLLVLKEGLFGYEPQAGVMWPADEDKGLRYKIAGEILLI